MFAIITSISLAVSGRLLLVHIRLIFFGVMGEKIAVRIRNLACMFSSCFLLKAFLPAILFFKAFESNKENTAFSVIFIVLYYGAVEILPLSLV